MIKMINKITGTEMYVDDERLSEYIMAGHKRVDKIKLPDGAIPEVKKEVKPSETAEKIKKTIAKTKGSTRKKV